MEHILWLELSFRPFRDGKSTLVLLLGLLVLFVVDGVLRWKNNQPLTYGLLTVLAAALPLCVFVVLTLFLASNLILFLLVVLVAAGYLSIRVLFSSYDFLGAEKACRLPCYGIYYNAAVLIIVIGSLFAFYDLVAGILMVSLTAVVLVLVFLPIAVLVVGAYAVYVLIPYFSCNFLAILAIMALFPVVMALLLSLPSVLGIRAVFHLPGEAGLTPFQKVLYGLMMLFPLLNTVPLLFLAQRRPGALFGGKRPGAG